jgi:hypothetical protein
MRPHSETPETFSQRFETVEAPAPRSWIAVACAEHVARGRQLGIMQVCHGKGAPIRRLRAGDRIAYYSPTTTLGGSDKRQAFTAFGVVCDDLVFQADMGDGFQPFRRRIAWRDGVETPIQTLRTRLELIRDRQNWGYVFRFGLVKAPERDMDLIFEAMTRAAA